MNEKRFKLSKSAIPSQLSNFCDEDGMMLNSEVVRLLNDRDALQESNVNLFFLIQESESKIKRLEEKNEQLKKELDNFKPVMFQDRGKGTVILYSKGDSV